MKKKILIVDDEPRVQKIIAKKLRMEGFEPISAFDGKEGLEKAASEKPDLILLDIIMPKLDGISVLKKLKEDSEIDKIPVIILTNLSGKEAIVASLESGETDYLIKADYTLNELIVKIKEKLF